jgi:hypothetical protein
MARPSDFRVDLLHRHLVQPERLRPSLGTVQEQMSSGSPQRGQLLVEGTFIRFGFCLRARESWL